MLHITKWHTIHNSIKKVCAQYQIIHLLVLQKAKSLFHANWKEEHTHTYMNVLNIVALLLACDVNAHTYEQKPVISCDQHHWYFVHNCVFTTECMILVKWIISKWRIHRHTHILRRRPILIPTCLFRVKFICSSSASLMHIHKRTHTHYNESAANKSIVMWAIMYTQTNVDTLHILCGKRVCT